MKSLNNHLLKKLEGRRLLSFMLAKDHKIPKIGKTEVMNLYSL
jgi:hypothetical protein